MVVRVLLFVLSSTLIPLVVFAQSRGSAATSPLVWNSWLRGSLVPPSKSPAGLFSSFTPANDITITRIEIEALGGPSRSVRPVFFCPNGPLVTCTVRPSVRITNGILSHTVAFSDATILPVGDCFGGRRDSGSSTDSGPLELRFAAGTKIQLIAVPGDPDEGSVQGGISACVAFDLNITVQYRTH